MLIHEVSERTGLSQATLRYYERIGLVPPVPRDDSGHRWYSAEVVDDLTWLSCLRATGMGIEDLRRYRDQRADGDAREQRLLLQRHAVRLRAELDQMQARLDYIETKARLWAAREAGDAEAEAAVVAELEAGRDIR
ncbi:MerR family transcriptional regulator [Nocardioides mangrovi]|uniref:MerR family transcriptional regulator n=1 Tax=Nocardioides mangrovi TaxID=2874580 RepID=A0ABS7U9Q6_9ACTN|nr:MerR family transcriptional regulator [Nocardioides mangrovi]MBZ5737686.1 MerR family transcriptional regulator [Nocardioides mangrovi]